MTWPWKKTEVVEHPSRFSKFADGLKEINFDKDADPAKFELLGRALDELAAAEINYYYKRRSQNRRVSYVARWIIWISASAGTLFPLVAAASPDLQALAPWGYVALAVAAAVFAWNRLFGATEGHGQFVTTQLQLEQLLTQFRIKRLEIATSSSDPSEQRERYFGLFHTFTKSLYATILGETEIWNERLREEMKTIERQIQSHKMHDDTSRLETDKPKDS